MYHQSSHYITKIILPHEDPQLKLYHNHMNNNHRVRRVWPLIIHYYHWWENYPKSSGQAGALVYLLNWEAADLNRITKSSSQQCHHIIIIRNWYQHYGTNKTVIDLHLFKIKNHHTSCLRNFSKHNSVECLYIEKAHLWVWMLIWSLTRSQ